MYNTSNQNIPHCSQSLITSYELIAFYEVVARHDTITRGTIRGRPAGTQ